MKISFKLIDKIWGIKMNCKDCRYWVEYKRFNPYGECKKHSYDGSDYINSEHLFETQKDFGCNQYENKKFETKIL